MPILEQIILALELVFILLASSIHVIYLHIDVLAPAVLIASAVLTAIVSLCRDEWALAGYTEVADHR